MRRSSPVAFVALALALCATAPSARAAGTWTKAPPNPTTGGQAFGLWLMTDGTILSHGSALNHWVILTPDSKGSYANGTWKSVASSAYSRGGAVEHVLKDGRFLEAGGEYIYVYPGCASNCSQPGNGSPLFKNTEIFDPVANTWTVMTPALYEIADTGTATLSDGRVFSSSRTQAACQIFDPTTNKWTAAASIPLGNGDENSWASLQNGGVLAVGYNTAGAAIYDPAKDKWIKTGPVPAGFKTGDACGISQMFDGRVLVYGLGQTYIYTPGPTASDPGSWELGPKMLDGDEAEDEYSDTLPNGKVWAGLVKMTYGPGVILQEFDPETNTVSSAQPPPDMGNPYPIDYVNLPNGQVMVTSERNDWIYTPDTPPKDEWRPVVTSVKFESGNTYTLTGTQISGLINGADEGDDMTMAENYPIVWLKDEGGNVYYCRSFNFSNMMPSKGNTPETCQFTTPKDLPEGSYSLFVSAVGVQSKDPYPFTVGTGGPTRPTGGGTPDGGAGAAGAAGTTGTGGATGAGAGGTSPSGTSTGGTNATTGTTTPGTGATTAGGGASSQGGPAPGVAGNGARTTSGGAATNAGAPGNDATANGGSASSGCGCRTDQRLRRAPRRGNRPGRSRTAPASPPRTAADEVARASMLRTGLLLRLTRLLRRTGAAVLIAGALVGCGSDRSPSRASEATHYAVRVSRVDTRFETRDHFMASIEMQLSGEPFAEAMGRDLAGYSRTYTCQSDVCTPDLYVDPLAPAVDGGNPGRLDVAGFSSAIESYEYSKQPMNNAAFESGAGTSLLFGPVLNPDGATGAAALGLARSWVTHMANSSNATTRFIRDGDDSPLGWPGLWLTLQPYSSWDPDIHPTHAVDCSLSSDDNAGAHAAVYTYDYECNYDSLHLSNRTTRTSMTIDPGSSGFLDWKESLWAINYLQSMHDIHEQSVDAVNEEQLASVGTTGNTVGPGLQPGTYLGSSDIEGFQAGNFLQILDNQAEQWLTSLSTTDGKTLDGFGGIANALSYSDDAPLRWFPASIRVTEDADDSGFPRPSAYAVTAGGSHLLDLAGLLGAYASAYALTDAANAEIGGSQSARVYFDGDPFPVQNQSPDGEPTLHDRALAMMRVLIVNISRLHFDAKSSRFADDAEVRARKPQHGETLSADVAAYALLALRTARRSLHSELSLYGNTKPDTAGIPCPLDAFPLSRGDTLGALVDRLIQALAATFYDDLTAPDGRAFSGWDLANSRATDDGTALDAHTAAIRGLLTAYLATGATRFRDRAERVWTRLEGTFYDPRARVYRPAAGDHGSTVTFTPRRFGLLQGALRDTYELVAALPGNDAMRALIEGRVGRLNALVLDGWDDRNGDDRVQWPEECAHVGKGADGQPLGLGGLQMGERALTGETGPIDASGDDARPPITTDRDHDCVPEISAVGLPAALARSITFELVPLASPGDGGGPG